MQTVRGPRFDWSSGCSRCRSTSTRKGRREQPFAPTSKGISGKCMTCYVQKPEEAWKYLSSRTTKAGGLDGSKFDKCSHPEIRQRIFRRIKGGWKRGGCQSAPRHFHQRGDVVWRDSAARCVQTHHDQDWSQRLSRAVCGTPISRHGSGNVRTALGSARPRRKLPGASSRDEAEGIAPRRHAPGFSQSGAVARRLPGRDAAHLFAPEIFGHIVSGVRTGKLIVDFGLIRRGRVRRGQIVFATSTQSHERLGAIFLVVFSSFNRGAVQGAQDVGQGPSSGKSWYCGSANGR